jgi:hypothetical protein
MRGLFGTGSNGFCGAEAMDDVFPRPAFEIAVVAIEIFIVYFYQSGCFLFNARPPWLRILAYLLFGAVLAFFSVFCPDMAVLPFVTFAGIFCISVLFFKGGVLKHASASLFCLALGISIEFLVSRTQSLFTGIDLVQLHDHGALRMIGATAAKLINLPVAVAFALFIGRHKETFAGRMPKTVPLLICQCFLTVILVGGFVADFKKSGEVTAFTLTETLGIIFVNIVLFLYFDKTVTSYEYGHRREMALLRSESQKKYYETIKSNLNTLFKLDHETKRLTSVLQNLIDGGKYAEASKFIASFRNSVKTVLSAGAAIVNTDNPVVGAVLCERLQRAETLGIKPEIDILIPDALAIDDVDLTVILGNALDNALEALELLPPDSERIFRLVLKQSDHYFFFEVVNSFDPGRQKKIRRGYGLRNIEAAVDKYRGSLSVVPADADGLFRITVLINSSSENPS